MTRRSAILDSQSHVAKCMKLVSLVEACQPKGRTEKPRYSRHPRWRAIAQAIDLPPASIQRLAGDRRMQHKGIHQETPLAVWSKRPGVYFSVLTAQQGTGSAYKAPRLSIFEHYPEDLTGLMAVVRISRAQSK